VRATTTIIGSKGVDKIFGDSENDKLDGRSAGDTLDGGTGFDTVDYSARSVAVNVTLNNSSPGDGSSSGDNSVPSQYNDNGADIIGDCEAVVGGSGPDKLVGSSVAQWFDGGGNNDSIYAGDGIDTIYGGSGV
jgi:hypothetical protein